MSERETGNDKNFSDVQKENEEAKKSLRKNFVKLIRVVFSLLKLNWV